MDSVGALLLFSRTKDVNIHKLRTLRRHVVAIELKYRIKRFDELLTLKSKINLIFYAR